MAKWIIILALTALAACAGAPEGQAPVDGYADSLTASQIVEIADKMAQAMLGDPLIAQAKTPPILALREVDNRTDLDLDPAILLSNVKSRIYQLARGKVFFRDDDLAKDVAIEQLKQSNAPLSVRMEGSDNATRVAVRQEGTVRSRALDVDYFLRGDLQQVIERNAGDPHKGASTVQIHFQLVDARTAVVVWEATLVSRNAGVLSSRADQPQPGSGYAPRGFATKFLM